MKLIMAVLILTTFSVAGCLEHKPEIPGYHWHGGSLYDSAGTEVASVVAFPFEIDSSQACIFAESGLESRCTYWENGQQAYDYVGKTFEKLAAARK